MQNAGTGIAIADLNGRLVHTNPALRRMWRIADADLALFLVRHQTVPRDPQAVAGLIPETPTT
jgi:hypothetical protein